MLDAEKKRASNDERSQRLFDILAKLDKMQREDGYHSDPTSRERRPHLRGWILIFPVLLAAAYFAHAI